MLNYKKIATSILILIIALFVGVQSASALVPDGMTVTFNNLHWIDSEGNTGTIAASATIDFLSDELTTTEGYTSGTFDPPPSGTVLTAIGMAVNSIVLSKSGYDDFDVLPILQAQNPSEDWDDIQLQVLPIEYPATGSDIQMNFFYDADQAFDADADWSATFPNRGPVMNFLIDGETDTSLAGTVNVSIASGVNTNHNLEVGAYANGSGGPSFMVDGTNNGDGSASATMQLPAGDWIIMVIGYEGAMTANGPPEGSEAFTVGGIDPWDPSVTATTITAGETATANLSLAFTMDSSNAGGAITTPQGTGSMAFTVTADPAITLSSAAQLMLYAFESVDNLQAGGAPDYFLASSVVEAGSFSSQNVTPQNLGAGTYAVVAFLDTDGDGIPGSGVDYVGFWGSPSIITLEEGSEVDKTSSPIELTIHE